MHPLVDFRILMSGVYRALLLSILLLNTIHGYATENWSYSGNTGPDNWSRISPKYSLCNTGQMQSPINITGGVNIKQPKLQMLYVETLQTIFYFEQGIKIISKIGSFAQLGENTFQLRELMIHTPSEHKIHGRNAEMEIHLLHTDSKGKLAAIIAVFVKVGRENPTLKKILSATPNHYGSNPLGLLGNASVLLPISKDYYSYTGSLTTPPCTEKIRWLVMKEPIFASNDQIKLFKQIIGFNSRGIMPTNGRVIKK
jgi:carbonic anhydrase